MYEMSPELMRRVLAEPVAAVLATVRADGTPYSVPLWMLWDGDVPEDAALPGNPPVGHAWFSGRGTSTWATHVARGSEASLCINVEGPPAMHAGIDGTVESWSTEEFDAEPIFRRIVEKYVVRGDPANVETAERYLAQSLQIPQRIFKLTPRRWRAIDLAELDLSTIE